MINFVRNNPDLVDFSQKWRDLINPGLQEHISEKIAWCWAKMISQYLNSDWDHVRRRLERQGDVCVYCSGEASCSDHIWPLALGGPEERNHRTEWNFNDSCDYCNRIKGSAPLVCPPLLDFTQHCQNLYGAEYDRIAQI